MSNKHVVTQAGREVIEILPNSIEFGWLRSPLKEPFVTALRRVDEVIDLVICFRRGHFVGYGSMTDIRAITGESIGDAVELLESRLIPQTMKWLTERRLKGCPTFFRDLNQFLFSEAPRSSGARAMIEIALSHLNQRFPSVHPKNPSSFRCDLTISLDTPENMAESAKKASSLGFNTFKIKLGCGDIKKDVLRMSTLASALPPDSAFRIDANQAWTVEDALFFYEKVSSRITPEMLEQPLSKSLTKEYSKVQSAILWPIYVDESVHTKVELAELYAQNACRGVVIKLLKTGGYTEAFHIYEYALEKNMGVMISSMMETKLGVHASLVFANMVGHHAAVDLDASFLAKNEPFPGGFTQNGPDLQLTSTLLPEIDLEKSGVPLFETKSKVIWTENSKL